MSSGSIFSSAFLSQYIKVDICSVSRQQARDDVVGILCMAEREVFLKKEIIKTEDAVGKILAHDITRIVKGEFKGSVFKKGQSL